jgi:enolase
MTNVHTVIAGALIGLDATDQSGVDTALIALDGTPNKSRLGGNATIAISLAVLDAAAKHAGVPLWRYVANGRKVRLPLPEIQIFGGGAHAGRRIDLQDLMVMPVARNRSTRPW